MREQCAGFVTHLEVVDAEIGGVRVGHVDGDQGDLGLFEDVGHARGHCFLDLELEHQIDAFGHKLFSVLNGNVGIIPVVEHKQLDSGSRGGSLDTLRNGHRKWHLGAQRGKAETKPAGPGNQPVLTVLRFGYIAPMHQRLEDAVNTGLGYFGFLKDLFESKGAMVLLQQFDHVESLRENGDQIESFDLRFGQPAVSLLWLPPAERPTVKHNALRA